MWSAIKNVGSFFGLGSEEPEYDMVEIEKILKYGPPGCDVEEEEYSLKCEASRNEQCGICCQNRMGTVTHLTDISCYIDKQKVDLKIFPKEFEIHVGDRVSYVAFRRCDTDEWTVSKILLVENESWLNDGKEKTPVAEPVPEPTVNKKLDVMDKSIVGKVCERKGRDVTIEPEMITFNLDVVEAGFIPVPGDWVELDTIVQTDFEALEVDTTNVVLEVMKVRPLRTRVHLGRVTHWDPKALSGTIRTEIFFTKDALDFGYTPTVGDQVVVDAIESNQHGFLWRALTVVLYQQSLQSAENQAARDKLNALLADKEDVVISRDCSFGVMDFEKEKSISVNVVNNGSQEHWITNGEFVSPSQMTLMSPTFHHGPLHLPPGKSLIFRFKARARFMGKSSVIFVWTFFKNGKSFKIGRSIEVNVKSDHLNTCMKEDEEYSKNYHLMKYARPKDYSFNTESVFGSRGAQPGVRPVKNPSFIPVRLGSFEMPRKLARVFESVNDTTYGHGQHKLSTAQLKEAYPCLNEVPNPSSYSERLHTLLYLEEIENIYRLHQFNIEAGCFRHYDKYLTLNIDGLSEKRPSLIIGDRIYVRKEGNRNDQSYQGYIHKIDANEIYIQFTDNFHRTCNGEYKIKFEISRGNFVKCHQAVKLVHEYLKPDWLFPKTVKYKPPQIIIMEETNYMGNMENLSNYENSTDDKKSENNEVINGCIDKVKQLSIDTPQDLVNTNMNPSVNNINVKNIINAENKRSRKECQSVSEPIVNQDRVRKCNDEKMKKTVKVSSLDSNKILLVDNDVSIVAEEGEEIKKITRNLYSCAERGVTGNGVRNCSMENDEVNSKVSLVFEHFKNAKNENTLQKKCKEENSDIANKAKTVEEVERLSSVDWKLPADNNAGSQDNTGHRRGKMSRETYHNKTTFVEETERFPCEDRNEYRTSTSSYNKKTRNNMTNRRGGKYTRSAKKNDERNKTRFWFEESDSDEAEPIVNEIKKRKIQWFNPLLNHCQKEAVRNILKGEARPLPYVIFGPPGTGKTITLVETILQIYHLVPDCRLLVGTPSNSSADLITQRLIESNVIYPGNLTRLVGYNYMQEGRLPVNLLKYTAVASMSDAEKNNAMNMTIGRSKITVGTCNTLGILYSVGFQRGHFSHVIIDEAGQGTEPELLIPLAFLNAKYGQSVLAGDPNQLGPVVLSRYAKEFGLGESLLVRLLHTPLYQKDIEGFRETHGYNPHLVTLLVENYRSLPEILALPSNLFYNGLLDPKVSGKDGKEFSVLTKIYAALDLPPTRCDGRPPSPILFHGVRGEDFQSEDSPSWFNPHEIMECMYYLRRLYDSGLTAKDCGIVTPYNQQAARIRRMIGKLDMELPKVGSVEEFQGQERMAIVMSSVRSNREQLSNDIKHNMGFIACPRRLNVALTRARAMLVIIGDPHLLALDVYWKSVLEYCVNNDAYVGCDLPYSLCEKE